MRARSRHLDAGANWAQIGGAVGAPAGALLALLAVVGGWTDADLGTAALTGLAIGAPVGALAGLGLAWLRPPALRQAAEGLAEDVDSLVTQLRAAVLGGRLSGRLALANASGGELDFAMREIVREPGEFAGWRLATRTRVRLDRLPDYFLGHKSRLVLLGEPGSGKSLAALRILEHVNTHDIAGKQFVAEVFPLASWGSWRMSDPDAGFEEWMADTLTLQWGLSLGDARRLVASDSLVPVFDGLDEVAEEYRRSCARELNSYIFARNERPFLVCCRSTEYQALAPAWVAPEDRAELVIQPLELREVREYLQRIPLTPPWRSLSDTIAAAAHATPDPKTPPVNYFDILRTPLHLTVALRAYEGADPAELLRPDTEDARAHLWERYLSKMLGGDTDYPRSDSERWLATLARLMSVNLHGGSIFWLHWLHWLDTDGVRLRMARRRLALVGGMLGGLIGAWATVGGIAVTMVGRILPAGFQIPMGVAIGASTGWGMLYRQPWTVRWKQLIRPSRTQLIAALVATLTFGTIGALINGGPGSVIGAGGAFLLVYAVLGIGSPVDDITRQALGPRGPYAVLEQSARAGFASFLLAYALFLVYGFFVASWVGYRPALPNWIGLGAVLGAAAGLAGGWDAVLWHFFLRYQLVREGALPRRLVDFLAWAGSPERECLLRVGGSYRFRHRELQQILASGNCATSTVTDMK